MKAIFEATVQVLLRDGLTRLTTTRVAERAGVSVGTLYQYIPNKHALLTALLAEHLADVAERVAAACASAHGLPADAMMETVVTAYLEAKLRYIHSSSALYAIAGEKQGTELVRRASERSVAHLVEMLRTAPDVPPERVDAIAFMLSASMAGALRAVLEGGPTPQRLRLLRSELVRLCQAYVTAAVQ